MKEKLNFNNKNFKITCIVSILLLLTLGIYILVTNAKDTYAVSTLSGVWKWNDYVDVSYFRCGDYVDVTYIDVNFTSNGKQYDSFMFNRAADSLCSNYHMHIEYGFNHHDWNEEIEETYSDKALITAGYKWTNDKAMSSLKIYGNKTEQLWYVDFGVSASVDTDFYNWFKENATPQYKCYYNSSTKKYVWTNISSTGSVQDGITDKTSCEAKNVVEMCYYDPTSKKFEWTSNSSGKTLYSYFNTKEKCENASIKLTLTDNNNTLQKCLTKNSSGTCTKWDTAKKEITIDLKPGLYTFDLENNTDYRGVKSGYKLKSFTLVSFNDGETTDLSGAPSSYYFPIINKEYKNNSILSFGSFNYQSTLSANWELVEEDTEGKIEKYTVKYAATGGSVSPEFHKVTPGGIVEQLPTPTRSGWTFLGWYTSESGGRHIGDGGVSFKPDGDITLYAHWEEIPEKTYVITYNANGGNSVPSATIYKGTGKISLEYPSRFGYVFTGWTRNPANCDNPDKIIARGKTFTKENVILYACWSKVDEESRCGIRSNPETSDRELIVLAVLAISTLSWLYSYFIMKKVKQ